MREIESLVPAPEGRMGLGLGVDSVNNYVKHNDALVTDVTCSLARTIDLTSVFRKRRE